MIAVAQPTLSWFNKNEELRQSVKYMKRYAGDDYTFIINRAKLDDRGEYIIRAENTYGYREEVVFLNVQRAYTVLSGFRPAFFRCNGKIIGFVFFFFFRR